MSRAEQAAKLSARREARRAQLRETLSRRRAAAKAELERRRAKIPTKPEKKRRWWLLLLLLLLLMWRACLPDPEVEVPPAPVTPGPVSEAVEAPAPPRPPARVSRRERPALKLENPGSPAWLDRLRMQVSARSPRLAACLVGGDQGGALRWTATVAPDSGRVSDQKLEPTLGGEPLSREQLGCALAVLSEPPYTLMTEADGRDTPVRVGLVLEF